MSSSAFKSTFNTQLITCYTFHTHFLIESNAINNSIIHVDRKTKKMTMKEKTENEQSLNKKKAIARKFSSLLGIAEIEGIRFIVFCEECRPIGNNIKLFQIGSIFFVSYFNEAELVYSGKKHEILKKTQDINQLFSRGFYFSNDYNITQPLQFQSNPLANQFVWNKSYLKSLKKHASKQWITPIIQGYVGNFTTQLSGAQIEYFLISRRSCEKGGTRYFDRGVNQEGFVANFVETEQIVYVGTNFVASDIIIRGSVPIYFQQTGLTTQVKISRSNQLARESFQAHFQYCLRRYGRVMIINLLDTKKSGQNSILNQYEQHIKQIQHQKLKYFYYNFHQQCPKNSFHNVNKPINTLSNMHRNLGYFLLNLQNNSTVNRQMGVFRVNCLDCLDRTNVFQSKIAASTLEHILFDLGINVQDILKCSLIEQMDKNNDNLQLIKQFKTIWADNGDQISFHYTGTGSTHSDFTRSGKRGITGVFKHKVKTITRFYNQNFWDFNKMKLVDLVLQSKKSQLQNQRIPSLLKSRQNQYCEYKDIILSVMGWKIAKQNPPVDNFPFEASDIYIIGLQMIQSNSVTKWVSYLLQSIQASSPSEKFIQFVQSYGNNNLCVGFIKSNLKSHISNIQYCSVKFSNLFNYISNKSASVIRFEIDDNSLVFGSCQLEYGTEYSNNRIQNLKQIYKNAFQGQIVGKKKSDKFESHEYKFLLGNLNLTTNIQDQKLKKMVKQLLTLKQQSKIDKSLVPEVRNKIRQITKFDEFVGKDENAVILRDYQEPAITFIPGYKYQKGKIKLDQSRSPGWVDRILHSSQRNIECLYYSAVEMYISDHLPILGQYRITVDKQDAVKKQFAYEDVLKELKLGQPIEVYYEDQRTTTSLTRITQKDIKAEEDK